MGAYRIPLETGLLIPSDKSRYRTFAVLVLEFELFLTGATLATSNFKVRKSYSSGSHFIPSLLRSKKQVPRDFHDDLVPFGS